MTEAVVVLSFSLGKISRYCYLPRELLKKPTWHCFGRMTLRRALLETFETLKPSTSTVLLVRCHSTV